MPLSILVSESSFVVGRFHEYVISKQSPSQLPKKKTLLLLNSQLLKKKTTKATSIQNPTNMSRPNSPKSGRPNSPKSNDCRFGDQDDTIKERVAGLGEMFPTVITTPIAAVGRFFTSAFNFVCDASWVFFTTLAILYGPVVFETENQRRHDQVGTTNKSEETGQGDSKSASKHSE